MRLLRATIYGFGNWVDDSIDFSADPFICIYGDNESGKSTLQQFILFMLFGLLPKQRAFYRPKTSSRMGGRLTVVEESVGEFTIERLDEVRNGAAKCYIPDGGEFDEAWLKDRLHGMTYATYQSIFSFSATDLAGIKNMKEADLGEVLLGIGLTGSKNIHVIEKRLDSQIGDLFKVYGKKPAINQQLESLDELFKELTTHKNDEASYREKKVSAQVLEDEIRSLQEQYKAEREKRTMLEKQQQALPLLEDYHYCTSQLANYPDSLPFPENGLERLHALNEKRLPLKSELSVLQSNQKQYKEKQAMLQQELYEPIVYDQAKEIIQAKQLYLENKREIARLDETIKKADMQLHTELDQLHLGLTAKDLATITFPFHVEKAWNQLKQDNEQLNLEKEQLQQENDLLTRKKHRLLEEQQELNAAQLPNEHVETLTEKVNMYKEQHYIKSLKQHSDEQRLKWESIKKKKEKRSRAILIGSIVTMVLLGMIPIMTNGSNLLFSIPVIVLMLGAGQWLWQKQSIKTMNQMLQGDKQETPTHAITFEEKEEADRLLAASHKTKQDLDSLDEQRKTLEIQTMQWEERKKGLETKEKRLNQQISDQHKYYPFLEKISILYWPEFFHTMKQLLKLAQEITRNAQEIASLEASQSEFTRNIGMFFAERKWERVNKPVETQIEMLEDLLEHYRDAQGVIKQYDELITENAEQQRIMNQKMTTYENEINALFAMAKVETEDAFYRQAKQVDEKQKISEQRDQLGSQLSVIFSQAEYQELLEREPLHENDLRENDEQSAKNMEALEKDIEVKRQELADVNADLSIMETSESYSNTTHRFQMEQEQLQKVACDWAVLKTAKEMLVDTKRKYRDKYLHKVVDKTSAYFATLTGNHYKRIYTPAEGVLFQVESQDSIRYTINELSQGTIDQLYVSLRLAISEVMSQEHLLPFIIDDAFVHFDAIRIKRMMDILADLAQKQQIILFTCKEEIRHSTKSAKMIELGNTIRINE